MIKGLHHNVYRCRDSEETRVFYEDFLGLRFVSAFEIDGGRGLHTFFEIRDG
jgi:catechol 2,3-dioxygenase-like lactoylglutathione lyase family enzyme